MSQCTYRCVVLPDGQTPAVGGYPVTSQCTYRCVVLPDSALLVVINIIVVCLNAPTGAWCSLTAAHTPADWSSSRSQCTYRCVVLPDAGLKPRFVNVYTCLNAPTGAWCSLTPVARGRIPRSMRSQCTYRCVVLPDAMTQRRGSSSSLSSQCTYRCVVLPDSMCFGLLHIINICLNAPTGAWCSLTGRGRRAVMATLIVSMHLQVRGAP